MNRVFKYLIIGLIVLTLAVFVSWVTVSYQTFPETVLPGETYMLDGRVQRVPRLPHTVYKSGKTPSLTSPVPKLSDKDLIDLRNLVINTHNALREAGVEFWISGGTGISAALWKQLMCYDDDHDVHTMFDNREYLWSDAFAGLLEKHGLESFFLRGASLTYATREGAGVRVRKQGTQFPTVDIFFVKEFDDGTYRKIHSWNGTDLHTSDAETWPSKSHVFPVKTLEVDEMEWPAPNKLEELLDIQYSPAWKDAIKSPKPLTASHKWVFWFTNKVSAWSIRTPGTPMTLEEYNETHMPIKIPMTIKTSQTSQAQS